MENERVLPEYDLIYVIQIPLRKWRGNGLLHRDKISEGFSYNYCIAPNFVQFYMLLYDNINIQLYYVKYIILKPKETMLRFMFATFQTALKIYPINYIVLFDKHGFILLY